MSTINATINVGDDIAGAIAELLLFKISKRPVADILIASFAARFQGIITRNASDFRKVAPMLTIVEP